MAASTAMRPVAEAGRGPSEPSTRDRTKRLAFRILIAKPAARPHLLSLEHGVGAQAS